jgi:hypothetical protein
MADWGSRTAFACHSARSSEEPFCSGHNLMDCLADAALARSAAAGTPGVKRIHFAPPV